MKPDIVVGVGNDVFNALERNANHEAKLAKIPFPGRLNLNARYVPIGKRLIKEGKHNHLEDIARIQTIIKGTPDKDGKIAKAIKTDWYYFREVETYFREVLKVR